MALTPTDVANRKFTVTRLGRSGYDESEVDEFLDEVEAELTRLLKLIADLQAKAEGGAAGAAASPSSGTAAAAGGQAGGRTAPAPSGPPEVQATTILTLAQRTAEEHVASAKKEADGILAEARALGEQRRREIEARHQQMLGGLQQEQARLQQVVEDLRGFERNYRAQLRDYLQGQLRDLDAGDGSGPRAAVATAGPAFATFGAGGKGGDQRSDPKPRVVNGPGQSSAGQGSANQGNGGQGNANPGNGGTRPAL